MNCIELLLWRAVPLQIHAIVRRVSLVTFLWGSCLVCFLYRKLGLASHLPVWENLLELLSRTSQVHFVYISNLVTTPSPVLASLEMPASGVLDKVVLSSVSTPWDRRGFTWKLMGLNRPARAWTFPRGTVFLVRYFHCRWLGRLCLSLLTSCHTSPPVGWPWKWPQAFLGSG